MLRYAAIVAIGLVTVAGAVLAAVYADRRLENMEIDWALKRVRELYECAKTMDGIRDPLAWALYHTWREADEDGRRNEDENER